MKRAIWMMAALALLLGGVGKAKAGPVSPLYVTDGTSNNIYVIQGNSVINSFPEHEGAEYAIAVAGDVRTLGSVGGPGSQYTLSGTYTGVNYANPFGPNTVFDGTTDGTHNYTVDFSTGDVYQTNRDWSSPTVLFNTGFGGSQSLGITYDPTNNSLWISGFTSDQVEDFSLSGTPLSGFTAMVGSDIGPLAMDYADGTLWIGEPFTANYFQYSRSGTLLSTASYPSLAGLNILGGEFAFPSGVAAPEPSTLTLFGLGSLGLVGYGRRRRKA